MMYYWREEKGFTLFELLAVLAILGFVITAIFTFYVAGLRSWNRGVELMEYQQSARIAMDTIIRELRYATEVTIPSKQEIHFRIKGDSKTYVFRKLNQELVYESRINQRIYSHTKIALAITDLSFATDDTDAILISISTGTELKTVTLTGKIRPRNLH